MATAPRGRALTMDVPASRGRGVKAAPAKPQPSKDLLAKARVAVEQNKIKNAADRELKKAQKEVHKLMLKEGIEDFRFIAGYNGSDLACYAEISAGTKEVISVEKLKALVDPDTFMKVISATKTSVEAECGTDVVLRSTVTVNTEASLKVGEVKD